MARRDSDKGTGSKRARQQGGKGRGDSATDRARQRREEREAETQQPSAAVEWAKSIAIALVLFLVLRTFLVQTFVITSGSMEETLLVGDMLLVNRRGDRHPGFPGTEVRIPGYSTPRAGATCIVFDPHARARPHAHQEARSGLPGDTHPDAGPRALRERRSAGGALRRARRTSGDEAAPLDVNGSASFLPAGASMRAPMQPTRDNVGAPGHTRRPFYFMLGDNREKSLDSRYWGFLEGTGGWRVARSSRTTRTTRTRIAPFPALREVRWNRIGRRHLLTRPSTHRARLRPFSGAGQACAPRSWPQAASMSRPRVSRTATDTPRRLQPRRRRP